MTERRRRLIPLTPVEPDVPVACTLTATEAVARAGEVRRLAAAALTGVDRGARTLTLRFSSEPGVADAVEALAAAEAECCAFLGLGVERAADEVLLHVEAPEGAEAALDTLEALAVRE